MRYEYLLLIAAMSGAVAVAVACAGEEKVYDFGRDKLRLRSAFELPSQDDRERCKRIAEGGTLLYQDLAGLPLRKGVKLYRESHDRVLTARDGNDHMAVTVENIGYFVSVIEREAECRALIMLLHSPDDILTADAFQIIVEKVSNAPELPFKILDKNVESKSIAAGCTRKDGYWLWNFIIREDASICEYKYVVDKDNHMTQFRRVLIEGPQSVPHFGGNAGLETLSNDAKQHYETYVKCVDYLIALIKKNNGG